MDGEGTGREDIMAEVGEEGGGQGKVVDGPMVKREDGWWQGGKVRHGSGMQINGVAATCGLTVWQWCSIVSTSW